MHIYIYIYIRFGNKYKTKFIAHQQKCSYSLRENTEFFMFLLSRVWTEYGDILCKSPYSVGMRENTYQKKMCIWKLFS